MGTEFLVGMMENILEIVHNIMVHNIINVLMSLNCVVKMVLFVLYHNAILLT